MDFSIYKTRKEKELFLKEVLQKLSISHVEMEIYILSLEVLEEEDLDIFFQKITQQFHEISQENVSSIAPLTSNLL